MLRYSARANDSRALFLVERTLDMMQRGGIYDHLGGGFSRYSIDEQWLVPHFEKMLYDNALLVHSYLETWQITKKDLYRDICEDILQYILREMTHAEGGFYSAEDADSEGHEGLYYTWTYEEIHELLDKQDADLFCKFYDVKKGGNFEGRSVLHTQLRESEFAKQINADPVELSARLKSLRQILRQTRDKRIHPLKDDKF